MTENSQQIKRKDSRQLLNALNVKSQYPIIKLSPTTGDVFAEKTLDLIEPVKIGRKLPPKCLPSPTNGLFDSKVLSRNHAEIFFQDGKVFIQDKGSSNGTFINSKRLSDEGIESSPFQIMSNDVLEFVSCIVKFSETQQAPPPYDKTINSNNENISKGDTVKNLVYEGLYGVLDNEIVKGENLNNQLEQLKVALESVKKNQASLSLLQNQLVEEKDISQKLKKKLEEIIAKSKAIEQENLLLKSETAALKTERSNFDRKADEFEKNIINLTEENTSYGILIDGFEKEKKTFYTELNELKLKLQESLKTVTELENEIKIKNDKSENDLTREQLESTIRKKSEEYQTNLKREILKLNSKENIIRDLKNENENLIKELNLSQLDFNKILQSKKKLELEIKELNKTIEKQHEKESTIAEGTEKAMNNVKEKDMLHKIKQLEEEVDTTRKTLMVLEIEKKNNEQTIESLKSRLEEEEKNSEELKEKLNSRKNLDYNNSEQKNSIVKTAILVIAFGLVISYLLSR
ncbi:hypothetical protein HDU92_000644 [Lobulomyces angularis]|nr:hypothetical protein HDU92_000644 [Lobulomyces angularis]